MDYFTHLSDFLLSILKCFREQKCFVCPFTERGSAQSVARGSGRLIRVPAILWAASELPALVVVSTAEVEV